MKSRNQDTDLLLRFLKDDLDKIEKYINNMLQREYIKFNTREEIDSYFNGFFEELYGTLTDKEINDIRYYTGYSFKDINAIYRNNWTYDVNGHISRKRDYEKISEDLEKVFCRTPKVPGNIVVYRGVDIQPFKSYGINSIEELVNMKGQYMYESGLTSTSLLKETSFYDRKLDNQKYCNILIEYYIPEECTDAIPLLDSELSYSDSQHELLLCPSTLTKVLDVEILGDKAILKVAYIPVNIWEPGRKANLEDKSRL